MPTDFSKLFSGYNPRTNQSTPRKSRFSNPFKRESLLTPEAQRRGALLPISRGGTGLEVQPPQPLANQNQSKLPGAPGVPPPPTEAKGLYFEAEGKKLYSPSGLKYDAIPAEQAPGYKAPGVPRAPEMPGAPSPKPELGGEDFKSFYGDVDTEKAKSEYDEAKKAEQTAYETGQAGIQNLIESSQKMFDTFFNNPDLQQARKFRGQALTELSRLNVEESEAQAKLKKDAQLKSTPSWSFVKQSGIISDGYNAQKAGYFSQLALASDEIETGERYAGLAWDAGQSALKQRINLIEQTLTRATKITEQEREEYTSILNRANDLVAEKEKSRQTTLSTYIDLASAGVTGISPTDNLEIMISKSGPQLAAIAKQKATATGGFTPAQINSTVNSVAGAFDNEQIVKDYNQINAGYQTIKSIGTATTSPADDITFIYAFAKIMDPNSVVREGEYNTIQKYAQTWADNFGFTAKRIFSNTNFLSQDAKQKMLSSVQAKVNTASAQYANLYKEYQRQIQDALSGRPRTIQDYSKAFPTDNQIQAPTDNKDPLGLF